jgi:hypothetical protein
MANRRLVEIWRAMNRAELAFEEWIMLENIARRLERRIAMHHGQAEMPLDREQDRLAEVAAKANRIDREVDEALGANDGGKELVHVGT